MAPQQRGKTTSGDLLKSLFLVGGLVAAIVIAFNVMSPDRRVPERVDYSGALELVREEYPYDVVVPEPVPDGWRATSIAHPSDETGNRWRLGFISDDDGFVGIEQSDGEIQSYLLQRLDGFEPAGTTTIDGAEWDRMEQTSGGNDLALVRTAGGVVTIVRGTEEYGTLGEFASRLSSGHPR